MIDVLPGIGIQDKEFEGIKEKIILVSPFVTWIHIDVADNTLVPNETFRDFSQWKDLPSHLSFEAHLMVANPEKYVKPLLNAGFKRLIAHIECQDPRRFLDELSHEDTEVGLSLDGPSPVEEIEPYMDAIDCVLVMGIEAGFSGQSFQQDTLEKIKQIHHHFPEVLIEVDGGVNDKTAPAIVEAGAKRLVTTSYLFGQKGDGSLANALETLRQLG